jgi:hypothetical protein
VLFAFGYCMGLLYGTVASSFGDLAIPLYPPEAGRLASGWLWAWKRKGFEGHVLLDPLVGASCFVKREWSVLRRRGVRREEGEG